MPSVSINLLSILPDPVARDRRRHCRFETACNALIRLSAALTFRCEVRNLSIEAAQVLCDARYALLMHPRTGTGNPRYNRPIELSIAFPVDGIVRGFATHCHTKYCEPTQGRRVAAGTTGAGMIMGLEFIDVGQGPRQLLTNFLGSLAD